MLQHTMPHIVNLELETNWPDSIQSYLTKGRMQKLLNACGNLVLQLFAGM